MSWLKELSDRRFEKKWEKLLPQEYKDMSGAEIEQRLSEVRAEVDEFFKDEDFKMKDLEQLMEKHGDFLDMANKWKRYHMEKKLRET